jgi:transcriptional regulator with XRE-family HTH domain
MDASIGETWPGRQLLITQRLRRRRGELGLTQKQVVTRLARAGLHTTNRAVSSLEHGAGVDVAKLPELAAALDCTVTYLVGLTDDPHRWEPDQLSDEAPPRMVASHPNGPAPSWILGADVPDRGSRLGSDGRSG